MRRMEAKQKRIYKKAAKKEIKQRNEYYREIGRKIEREGRGFSEKVEGVSAFFSDRFREAERKVSRMELSGWYLFLFSMCFSMTISSHFYVTIFAFLFCVGVGAAYAFRFLRPVYFIPVIRAGFKGFLFALVPMIFGLMMGRGLEGSLYWGLSMMGVNNQTISEETDSTYITDEERQRMEIEVRVNAIEVLEEEMESGQLDEDAMVSYRKALNEIYQEYYELTGEKYPDDDVKISVRSGKDKNIAKKVAEKTSGYTKVMNQYMQTYLLSDAEDLKLKISPIMVWVMLGLLFVFSLICFIMDRDYGACGLSICFYCVILIIMLSAEELPVPSIMQPTRVCNFLLHALCMALGMCLDEISFIFL